MLQQGHGRGPSLVGASTEHPQLMVQETERLGFSRQLPAQESHDVGQQLRQLSAAKEDASGSQPEDLPSSAPPPAALAVEQQLAALAVPVGPDTLAGDPDPANFVFGKANWTTPLPFQLLPRPAQYTPSFRAFTNNTEHPNSTLPHSIRREHLITTYLDYVRQLRAWEDSRWACPPASLLLSPLVAPSLPSPTLFGFVSLSTLANPLTPAKPSS
eukprot:SM006779S20389  [mRNA]  locus=s6779:113:754:+ [translate_table: standard]